MKNSNSSSFNKHSITDLTITELTTEAIDIGKKDLVGIYFNGSIVSTACALELLVSDDNTTFHTLIATIAICGSGGLATGDHYLPIDPNLTKGVRYLKIKFGTGLILDTDTVNVMLRDSAI